MHDLKQCIKELRPLPGCESGDMQWGTRGGYHFSVGTMKSGERRVVIAQGFTRAEMDELNKIMADVRS